MRSSLFFARLALAGLLAGLVPSCASQECAIDTDCELGFYCSLGGACLPRGTSSGTDAGPRTDVGVVADTGPRDAAVSDVPANDAPTDAPMDAGMSCPAVAATYMLTSLGVGCTDVGASTMTLSGPAPSECAFEIMFDDASVGVLALSSRNTFAGALTIAGVPTDCSMVFDASLASVDATCGACMFTAALRL